MDLRRLRETIRSVSVSSVAVTHGSLELARPLVTSRGAFTNREVSIIRVETPDGAFGYGEAAPLEGWGTESAQEVRERLDAIAASPGDTGAQLMEGVEAPATRFGLEVALLDLVAREGGVSLRRLLNPEAPLERVPVNATLGMAPPPEIRRDAIRLMREGFRCIKLKVGDANSAADIARIRAAKASGATIRIDANGAWSEAEAIEFLTRIGSDVEIEYCEQPVPPDPPEVMGRVAASTRVPIAADESCHPWPKPLDVIELRSADVLVLKPMVIGGLLRCIELWERATRHEMSVVFTSSIDSAIGRCAVAQMVAALPQPEHGYAPIHHGLATGDWFVRDVADLEIERGQIVLPDGPGLGIWPLLNAIKTS
jgi:o-succinylbenzoate synthase